MEKMTNTVDSIVTHLVLMTLRISNNLLSLSQGTPQNQFLILALYKSIYLLTHLLINTECPAKDTESTTNWRHPTVCPLQVVGGP